MVGFGMGGSLALWASVRLPDVVGAVVSFYGSQQIDFAGAKAAYLIHLADEDEFITDDEAAFMEATMRLEELDVEVIRHPGTRHGFGEPDGDTFDPGAFDNAWGRSVEFLEKRLKRSRRCEHAAVLSVRLQWSQVLDDPVVVVVVGGVSSTHVSASSSDTWSCCPVL